jgi:hypothetical protein
MDPDAKPVVEHQCRLIPKMKEVVRNEVLKLIDAGIIYPIADSRWVSPVHCVPKCRWISCRKNTGYHATDPRIRTQGAERGRSWIATKHGDGSLEWSNALRTAERDAELYPGSGPSW